MTLSIPSIIWKPEFQAIMCQNVLLYLRTRMLYKKVPFYFNKMYFARMKGSDVQLLTNWGEL